MYYNPYFYSMPNMANIATNTARTGIFSRLFGNLSLGRIISGTERALNFANQAIPLVKQVKPIIGNAKTMFRVMNEFKKQEKTTYSNNKTNVNNNVSNTNIEEKQIKSNILNNEPTFFV